MIERAAGDNASPLLAAGLGCLIAIFLVLRLPVQAGVAFLAAAIAILVFFNRRAALYFIIPAMALSPELPVLGIPVGIDDFLMVPLVAGWLAHLCVFKGRQRTPLDRVVVAYLLVGVLATLWGAHLGTAHWTTNKDISSPFHLLKRLEFLLVFFILVDTLTTANEARHFAYVLIASMVGVSLFGLGSFLSNHVMALRPGVSAHEAGVASMIAAPLALSLIPAGKPSARILLGAAVAFSIAVLPLSLGRNFIAVTGLIVLYVALFQQRWALLLLPIFLIGLYLYPSHITERVLSFQYAFHPGPEAVQADAAALVYRADPIKHWLGLTLAYSPVLGFGLASVPLSFIDSEYGVQLAYTGLTGLAVFLLLGVRLFRLAKQATMAAHSVRDAGLARGLQLVLVAYAIYSVFASSVSPTHVGEFIFV
ncbi:MAG TPA: hypothetical protein VGA35_04970, partial [bacterium]